MQRTDAVLTRPSAGLGARLRPAGLALSVTLLVGLALRVAVYRSQLYIIHPDETFQYFEPAHRLVFGSGVVTWEYLEGIRSWLLPGVLAGVMRLVAPFSDSPQAYVGTARAACAVLSLSVVLVGFRLAERRHGTWAGVLTGGFCALWFALLWFAPTVMTEVLSAHVALLALCYGGPVAPRRLVLVGFGLGLAACLRFQYAPALLAAALWQYRLDWRRWSWVACGGLAAVLPIAGLLDWVTLGTPFQSIWLNFLLNARAGVASAMGTEPSWLAPAYLWLVFWPAPLLLPLAVLGAFRAPALAIAAVATIASHAIVPHKELRFIYLAIAATAVLIGLGASECLRLAIVRRRPAAAWPATALLLVIAAGLSWQGASNPLFVARWHYLRALLQALQTAHAAPDLCGLATTDPLAEAIAGYTYLHRDVPLVLGGLPPIRRLAGAGLRLRAVVLLDGRPVPQFPTSLAWENTSRFNYLIAPADHPEAGFAAVGCFDDRAREPAGYGPVCLFRRPGGCDLPEAPER